MQYKIVKRGTPDECLYLHSEKSLLSWIFSMVSKFPGNEYYTIEPVRTDFIEWGTTGYSRRQLGNKFAIDVRQIPGQRLVSLEAMDAIYLIITSISSATLYETDGYIYAQIDGHDFEAKCNQGKWEPPKMDGYPILQEELELE